MKQKKFTFPVNQAVCGIFIFNCMVAVLHLSRDGEQLRRVLKNLKVCKVQTIIETVQAQLMNLTFRDSQVCGLNLIPESVHSGWINISQISEPVGKLMHTEVFDCSDSVVSWRDMSSSLREHGRHTSKTLCKAKSTEKYMTLQLIRCSSTGGFSLDTPQHKSSINQKDDGRERNLSIRIPRNTKIYDKVRLRSQRRNGTLSHRK